MRSLFMGTQKREVVDWSLWLPTLLVLLAGLVWWWVSGGATPTLTPLPEVSPPEAPSKDSRMMY